MKNDSLRTLKNTPAFLCALFVLSGCSGGSEGGDRGGGNDDSPRILFALPNFQLTDQLGKPFGLEDLKGKVWVANFIFTRCPSTCPAQTSELAKLGKEWLKLPQAKEIALVSITVDPETDTPETLENYALGHTGGIGGEDWKFLTGEREKLWKLSRDGFKMAVFEDAQNVQMPIAHSSRFILVDRRGNVRGTYDGLQKEGRKLLETDFAKVLAEKSAPAKQAGALKKFPYPEEVIDPPWLNSRAELQRTSAGRLKVFHGFQFEDKVESSRITFENRIVDDAGKFHKAVHYDHGNGVAVADVDGDGLTDVYFSTQLGPNQLWKNLGDGTFRDITTPAIALEDKIGVTASFADTDNDGDRDLFVTTVRGGNHFFENDGRGVFKDRTESAGLGYAGHSSGAVFFDYNNDGLVDLFLCNVGRYTKDELGRGGYCIGLDDAFWGHLEPDKRNEQSLLYENSGSNRFVDVSKKTELVDFSWAGDAAAIDVNEDGWQDLYVLSMQGHDEYYENVEGRKFVKKSREIFPKTPWGAMGIQVFDFDNDGRQDIFVTDMHSDMSEEVEVSAEKRKSNMRWEEKKIRSGGMSIFGNAFFHNQGSGFFKETSDEVGAENYWPWGLSQGDLNADGFVDVFVASSMNFPFRYGVNSVLLNNAGREFVDSEFILGVEPRRGGRTAKPWFTLDPGGADREHKIVTKFGLKEPVEVWGALGTRSSAIFDIDGDGDLDIVTNEFNDGPMVLVSNLTDRKPIHWISVVLRGTKSNRDGLGAVVRLKTGTQTYVKVHDGATGYLSHGVQPLYFGLGDASTVSSIDVRWPSGKTQTISEPPINEVLEVTEEP